MTTDPDFSQAVPERPLHTQNGIYRALVIEMRAPGGAWKRIRGDETMNKTLTPGVAYEVRVMNPSFELGIGIGGDPIMTPSTYLPLRD